MPIALRLSVLPAEQQGRYKILPPLTTWCLYKIPPLQKRERRNTGFSDLRSVIRVHQNRLEDSNPKIRNDAWQEKGSSTLWAALELESVKIRRRNIKRLMFRERGAPPPRPPPRAERRLRDNGQRRRWRLFCAVGLMSAEKAAALISVYKITPVLWHKPSKRQNIGNFTDGLPVLRRASRYGGHLSPSGTPDNPPFHSLRSRERMACHP